MPVITVHQRYRRTDRRTERYATLRTVIIYLIHFTYKLIYEGYPINKLLNSIMLLIFKV